MEHVFADASLLERIRSLNKSYEIFSCNSFEFNHYGHVLHGMDFNEYIVYADAVANPEDCIQYIPHIKDFEGLSATSALQKIMTSNSDIQVGWCRGTNTKLNALEYHKSPEVIIAVTEIVLILGLAEDIREHTYDITRTRIFFVPKKTGIYLNPGILHFAPIQVREQGFCAIIALPQGTNLPLDAHEPHESLLFAKNKWLLAHPDSEQARRGAHPGLIGERISIQYDA